MICRTTIKLLVVLILLAFSLEIFAQQSVQLSRPPQPISEEEFGRLTSNVTDSDSLLNLYSEYALSQIRRNPQRAFELSKEILELPNIDSNKKSAFSSFIKAEYYFRPAPDSTLKYSKKAEELFEQLNYNNRVVPVKLLIARSYSRLNEYLKSEEEYFEILDYINKHSLPLGNIENELTDLYIRVGAVDIAQERLSKELENESILPYDECRIRLKLSNAYKRNKELKQAKQELLVCTEIEGLDIPFQVAMYKGLSDIERLLDNPEERLKWIKKSIDLQEKNNSQIKDFTSYLFLTETYYDLGQYDKSDSLLAELEDFDLRRVQLPSRINFMIFQMKNEIRSQKYSSAIILADQALKMLERTPLGLLVIDVITLKAEALEGLGDFEEAYNVLKEVDEKQRFLEEAGRIREEEINRVRFQMRAKNMEIDEISDQLGTMRVRNGLVVLLTLLIGGYLLYRYRLNTVLQEEKTRNRIAKDLHDDLSGTLSSISFFSEAARRESSNEPQKYLNRIEESATEAREKINDIIWAIDPENDDWDSFLAKCRRYASELFESKNINYSINFDKDFTFKMNLETKQDLWLIFKEINNNLVKHSKATNVSISLEKEGNSLQLKIIDDGVGFDEEKVSRGNGLKNIKYRSKRLGARLDLETSPEEGTVWTILLPI